MKHLKLEIDGQKVEGRVAFSGGSLWVHVDGETFVYEDENAVSRTRRGGAAKAVHAGEIVAPMPGKIIKVMSGAGDQVKEGQVLIVMEAMKMEYTLKAQASGKVAEINVKAGDQVVLGQVLLKLRLPGLDVGAATT